VLLKTLRQACKDNGINIDYKTTISSMKTIDNSVRCSFNSGKLTKSYDLVIGSDGANSRIRDQYFDKQAYRLQKNFANIGTYSLVMKKPDFIEPAVMQQYMFPAARLYVIPLGGIVGVIGTSVSQVPTDRLKGGPRPLSEFKDLFEGKMVNDVINKLFSYATKNIHTCHLTFPFEIKMKTWANGRLLLIGDAAHAIVANPGLAMDLATTDSHRLAIAIANEAPTKGLDQTIEDFIKIRYPIVYRLQKESYKSFTNEKSSILFNEWLFFKRLFTHNTFVLNWMENRETRNNMADAQI